MKRGDGEGKSCGESLLSFKPPFLKRDDSVRQEWNGIASEAG